MDKKELAKKLVRVQKDSRGDCKKNFKELSHIASCIDGINNAFERLAIELNVIDEYADEFHQGLQSESNILKAWLQQKKKYL